MSAGRATSGTATSGAATSGAAMTADEVRTARLLFAGELADGRLDEADLAAPEVLDAVRDRGIPTLARRVAQAARRRSGRLDLWEQFTAPAVRARRAVLGAAADGPPKILVRMDEYPHWLAGAGGPDDTAFAPWREILAAHGCRHLVAVVPRVADDPRRRRSPSRELSDREVARIGELAADGTSFGLHGYEHRTRFPDPRLYSELGHRSPRRLGAFVDEARRALADRAGVHPRVLVPPFNTFGARQWRTLAARFDVITGGPESVLRMGLHPGPTFREGAVYLPVYPPLYDRASEVLPVIERHLEAATGLWTPIVLHWGWEAEAGWKALDRLVGRIAPYAADWEDFLDAVEKSR